MIKKDTNALLSTVDQHFDFQFLFVWPFMSWKAATSSKMFLIDENSYNLEAHAKNESIKHIISRNEFIVRLKNVGTARITW